MTDEHRGFLKHAGVPASVSARGLVGAASVSISRGNIYQPDEGGKVAFIVPARVYDPFTPEAPEPETVPQFGTLIDLIAVVPAVPRQWASRLGLAAWLGAIEPQLCRPAPVAIRRSPWSWLRAGATGLCILDRKALDQFRVLSQCREIIAEDPAHQRELRRVLERPFAVPPITVQAAERCAGANHG